jgi:hypothetical protein
LIAATCLTGVDRRRRAEDEDLDQFVEDDAVIDPRPMADQRVGWPLRWQQR